MERGQGLTLVMIPDVAVDTVDAFWDYERKVLPLLPRHGGRLERRRRSADGLSEVHVISFHSRAGYEAYLAAPERAKHRPLLEGADVVQRLLEVADV